MDGQVKVIAQVIQERKHQDRQWGGAAHDDTHSVLEWGSYICYQEAKLGGQISVREARERFIKIAALAVAAVESIDRMV
jgi:hypothetical protein